MERMKKASRCGRVGGLGRIIGWDIMNRSIQVECVDLVLVMHPEHVSGSASELVKASTSMDNSGMRSRE